MVKKSEHAAADKIEHGDEPDEIEFPFTPPTYQVNTPEYHTEKNNKIKAMVNEVAHLSDIQKQQLNELLIKHADRFSMNGENMERTDSVFHEIDTQGRRPFRERLRQYSPAIQPIIDKEVEKMAQEGVIVQSKSFCWLGSPIQRLKGVSRTVSAPRSFV
jgi:ATP-dependent helicase/DNAse subunit B